MQANSMGHICPIPVHNFGWKDLGQRKRVWVRRGLRSVGLLLEAGKNRPGWARAEGGASRSELLEGPQGVSV